MSSNIMPDPVRLFHITAIDNLSDICASGGLVCKNICAAKGVSYQNIAHVGAQGARAAKHVPNPPGGTVHDYVPFYFAPRSPMLLAINGGKVTGCSLRQEDILHFETTVPHVVATGKETLFYDRNATLSFSTPYTDLNLMPSVIGWDMLTEPPELDGFCKYFQNRPTEPRYVDRMERRQAEFLVKDQVLLSSMTKIGVLNEEKAQIVRDILSQSGIKLNVEVKTDWYFLGQ